MRKCFRLITMQLLILILIIAPVNNGLSMMRKVDDGVSIAVKQLWSADNAVRDNAKSVLVRLGSVAIPALILLVEDLLNNSYPRFPTGKELEGSKALDRFQSVGDQEANLVYDQIRLLAINRRLIDDVIEILGRIRDE